MRSDKAVLALLFTWAIQPQAFAAPEPATPERQGEKGHWEAPPRARQMRSPVPVSPSLLRRGENVYGQFCSACHGKAGDGRGWLAGNLAELPPDLRHAAEEHTPGELVWKIAIGHGLMPGWKRVLTKSDLWALAAHMENLRRGGTHAGEVGQNVD